MPPGSVITSYSIHYTKLYDYPSFNRSHFQAEDIYWGGDPGGFPGTGWLGRYLDGYGAGAVLGGAYLGTALAKSMVGKQVTVPAIPSASGYTLQVSGGSADVALRSEALARILGQPPVGDPFVDGLLLADGAALDSIAAVRNNFV